MTSPDTHTCTCPEHFTGEHCQVDLRITVSPLTVLDTSAPPHSTLADSTHADSTHADSTHADSTHADYYHKDDNENSATVAVAELAEVVAQANDSKDQTVDLFPPVALDNSSPPDSTRTDYYFGDDNVGDNRDFNNRSNRDYKNSEPVAVADSAEEAEANLDDLPTDRQLTAPLVVAAAQTRNDNDPTDRQLSAPPAAAAAAAQKHKQTAKEADSQAAGQIDHLQNLRTVAMVWAGVNAALVIFLGGMLAVHNYLKKRHQHAQKQRAEKQGADNKGTCVLSFVWEGECEGVRGCV
jgi:hypothetical protein